MALLFQILMQLRLRWFTTTTPLSRRVPALKGCDGTTEDFRIDWVEVEDLADVSGLVFGNLK